MSHETNGARSLPDADEIQRLGDPIYDRLRRELGPEYEGKFIAIHVDTGEYATGPSSFEARQALRRDRKPDGRTYTRKLSDEPEYALAARILAGEMSANARK
jgi:hypothetical protein